MVGNVQTGLHHQIINFPKADLAKPDVLLNDNHSPALEDGRVVEKYSFRRSNYFKFVGDEVKHVP